MAYLLIGPGETLDFSFDWTNELESGSPHDTIGSSDWSIAPRHGSPSTPSLVDREHIGAISAVTVADAMVGTIYRLTNRVTTAQGLIFERSITVRCENR